MNRIQLKNLGLSVTERGPERGTAPVLLLVHGFPLDHTMWQPQLEALSDSYRVIAPDLRGFGSSDVIAGVATMQQYADDLAELLTALQITQPVHFCGLSMGGYIAWQFAARHRQRLARLIVCDTRAAPDSAEAAQGRVTSANRVLSEGTGFLAEAMLPKLFPADLIAAGAPCVAATKKVMLAAPPAGVAAALLGMAQRPDMSSLLPRLDVPTLVLGGQHDAIVPAAEMKTLAGQIPGATFVEIAAAGHMATLEQPTAANAALRAFLK